MKRPVLVALIAFFVCFGQVTADSTTAKASIEINLASRVLSLYMDGELVKEYPVCVGKPSTPTPQGEYKVINKAVNPYWINKDVVVPPGPQNPLGIRWIGITRTIGIHGNNKPASIGTYASAGCIRMYNRDVEELYTLVPLSTPVTVKYDRIKEFYDKYSNSTAVILYPDAYKKGAADIGLELPEELLEKARELLKKPGSRPVAVSNGIGIFLNNSPVTCDAFEEQGDIYINYKAAQDVLGLTSELAEHFNIGIIELEGRFYINLTQTVKSYGGSFVYDKAAGSAYIDMKIIKVNGVFAGINLGDGDKADYMSVEAVKRLGYEYSEDAADVRLFGKGIMKLQRKNTWSINAANMADVLGGRRKVSSLHGVVDLSLPVYVRYDNQYYITHMVDGRLMLGSAAAYSIREKTDWAADAMYIQEENMEDMIDLEIFLEDYDYSSNILGTVIDIWPKEN